jgi:hypothetical protein
LGIFHVSAISKTGTSWDLARFFRLDHSADHYGSSLHSNWNVGTGIFLQEFAKDNKLAQIIEINISNLAAVPSIIYGLLGLFAFARLLYLPRADAVFCPVG